MSQESFSSLNLSHADKYIKTSAKARNIMNCFSNSRQEMNTWDVLTGRQGDSDSADSIGLGWTCGHMWPRNTVENKSRIRQATLRLHKPVARAGAAFSRHLSSWRVCSWRLRKNLGKQNLAWLQDSTKGLPQCAHLHSLTTPLWSLVIPCVVWILSLSFIYIIRHCMNEFLMISQAALHHVWWNFRRSGFIDEPAPVSHRDGSGYMKWATRQIISNCKSLWIKMQDP